MSDMCSSAAAAEPYTPNNYKSATKPIWCPGCGDYTVLNSVTKALALVQRPPHEVAVVSGIGCSSRIPAYTSAYGFHGVHGRALAAGANFVARAFAGDQNGTAEVIAAGIRHPGFSFIEILSPCVTFRPEQKEWKNQVHAAPVGPTDDAARAAKRIMTDDGFNIGVLYAGHRAPYSGGPGEPSRALEQMEEEFAL